MLRQSSIKGKSAKGQLKYKKLAKQQKEALESYTEGLGYESGLALTAAKKVVTNSPAIKEQNPKGTKQEEWRCKYYHPLFYNYLGHKDAQSKQCGIKCKTEAEIVAVQNAIFEEAAKIELDKHGTSLSKYKIYYC